MNNSFPPKLTLATCPAKRIWEMEREREKKVEIIIRIGWVHHAIKYAVCVCVVLKR